MAAPEPAARERWFAGRRAGSQAGTGGRPGKHGQADARRRAEDHPEQASRPHIARSGRCNCSLFPVTSMTLSPAVITAGVTKFSLPEGRDGTKLTPITVTLAAYQSLAAARADWDAFELAAKSGSCELVDGALIERTLDEVSEFHFQSPAGWGRGVIASAVCGVLWPPAMLLGALAGSVGGHTMTEVRRGLSHQAIAGLGAVMEKGTFIFVAIAGPGRTPPAFPGTRAVQTASFPLDSTAPVLRAALDLDDYEDSPR